MAAADGSAWYVTCDPASDAAQRLPSELREDRVRVGHDLKQLVTTLWADRDLELKGAFVDTLVAGYMVNQALRSQTVDDLAAQQFGAELPPKPVNPETGAEEQVMARRAAAGRSRRSWPSPSSAPSSRRRAGRAVRRGRDAAAAGAARMEKAGILIDRGALAAMSEEFGATLAALEARIYGLVGHEFNIGSPRQLEAVLFDELGLPSTKRRGRAGRRTRRSSRSCATSTRSST